MILFLLGAGVALIVSVCLFSSSMHCAIGISVGLLQIIGSALLTVRRLAFKRCLFLDGDALIVPSGFLRVRNARVPYTSIKRVWQSSFPLMAVLCITTHRGKFEIVAGMLADGDSYIAVANFLHSRAQDNLRGSSAQSTGS
jgi:hypothetical protein